MSLKNIISVYNKTYTNINTIEKLNILLDELIQAILMIKLKTNHES